MKKKEVNDDPPFMVHPLDVGVLLLSEAEYERFMHYMLNPGPVSPLMLEASALHKQLRKNQL